MSTSAWLRILAETAPSARTLRAVISATVWENGSQENTATKVCFDVLMFWRCGIRSEMVPFQKGVTVKPRQAYPPKNTLMNLLFKS